MSAVAPAVGHDRAERLARLADGPFDVVVIGAGIIGAATAWAAARAGASVAVVDRGDVAGATSSASSKLLHGGLRYLRNGQIGLVREAHRERWLNATVVAPHLVRPMPFLLSIGPDAPYRRSELRLGVLAYSALSRFRDGRSGVVSGAEARHLAPGVTLRDRRFVRYFDHQTDDARLVLAVLRSAEAHGAVWLNHAEVVALRTRGGRVSGVEVRDRIGDEGVSVDGRVVVNASGPWLDALRRLEDARARPSIRLSKGAHLLLAPAQPWSAAVTTPLPNGRVSFAVPWHDMLLLGTTDEPFEGSPDTLTVTSSDEAQILAEAGQSLDPAVLHPEQIRARFAGLRALPLGGGTTSGAHRETVITTGAGGMLSVAGGKLTTWRAIGLDVAARAFTSIGRPGPDRAAVPLAGAADPALVATELGTTHPGLPADVRLHLATVYGSRATDVLAPAREDPGLYEPIVAGAPEVMAQARYAVAHEGACTVEDILRRRTTLAIRGLSAAAAPRIEHYLEVPAAA